MHDSTVAHPNTVLFFMYEKTVCKPQFVSAPFRRQMSAIEMATLFNYSINAHDKLTACKTLDDN